MLKGYFVERLLHVSELTTVALGPAQAFLLDRNGACEHYNGFRLRHGLWVRLSLLECKP